MAAARLEAEQIKAQALKDAEAEVHATSALAAFKESTKSRGSQSRTKRCTERSSIVIISSKTNIRLRISSANSSLEASKPSKMLFSLARSKLFIISATKSIRPYGGEYQGRFGDYHQCSYERRGGRAATYCEYYPQPDKVNTANLNVAAVKDISKAARHLRLNNFNSRFP